MPVRKSQKVQDVLVVLPLIRDTGETAIGVPLTGLSTKAIAPDGSGLTGGVDYDEPIFSEPFSDGHYLLKFESTAVNKLFTLEDTSNPYVLVLYSNQLGVEPTMIEVWIVSQYPWERKDEIVNRIDTAETNIINEITGSEENIITTISGIVSSGAGVGDGSIPVDHNYGGVDKYRVTDENGMGIDNAYLYFYLKEDWVANRRAPKYVRAWTITDSTGRWKWSVNLDPGEYVIVVEKAGYEQKNVVNLTVT